MKIKIYSGLTLSDADVQLVLPGARWAPPIRRGELSRDTKEGLSVVGIVDGEFYQSFAVTPSEILDAMRAGLVVYGAGSMGAMRAAELHAFGMIGCGRIYERVCAQDYYPDDHLGVVFDEVTREQVSLPMVDFIATLDDMVGKSLIPANIARTLMQAYQGLHFVERHLDGLRTLLVGDGQLGSEINQALDLLACNVVNQKKRDGFELLRRVAHDLCEIRRLNALLND